MNITQEVLRIKNAYIQHGRITNPTEQAEQEIFTNQLVLQSHDIGLK